MPVYQSEVSSVQCVCLYFYAAVMCSSDLFLEACSHMLVTVVFRLVREEDRRTAYVCTQIGQTSPKPTDVP